MDIRQLCLVYIIITTMQLITLVSRSDSQALEQQDKNIDYDGHNYTNLNVFLWSGSGDGPEESSPVAKTPVTSYTENPEDCIGGQDCNIRPTSDTPSNAGGVIDIPETADLPDQTYWIVTELQAPSRINVTLPVIEDRLSALYTVAFTRQQARHLGVNPNRTATKDEPDYYRNRRRDADDNRIKVKVRVLSLSSDFHLVYFVSVNGRPVSAATAVHDMNLVSAREAADYLGYAVKIKARPYLDGLLVRKVQGVTNGQVLAYISVAFVIALLLVTTVLVAHKKKRRKNSVSSVKTNMAFCAGHTPQKDLKSEGTSTEDITDFRTPEPKPRNRSKISNTLQSMQAVNKFQKDLIPGPLTEVLNERDEQKNVRTISRHESIGEGQDPGVVGPIVWDLHCKQMQIINKNSNQDNVSLTSFDAFDTMDNNVTKMRQKFHELLDDAFTLFGSRNSSLQSDDSSRPSTNTDELRSKSAPFRSSANSNDLPRGNRPKTSANDDDQQTTSGGASCWAPPPPPPGEAWTGSEQSVFAPRPLSAGPFHRPSLNTEFISTDANLSPEDPAVPLIRAIRNELDKFPKPNSDSTR